MFADSLTVFLLKIRKLRELLDLFAQRLLKTKLWSGLNRSVKSLFKSNLTSKGDQLLSKKNLRIILNPKNILELILSLDLSTSFSLDYNLRGTFSPSAPLSSCNFQFVFGEQMVLTFPASFHLTHRPSPISNETFKAQVNPHTQNSSHCRCLFACLCIYMICYIQ